MLCALIFTYFLGVNKLQTFLGPLKKVLSAPKLEIALPSRTDTLGVPKSYELTNRHHLVKDKAAEITAGEVLKSVARK